MNAKLQNLITYLNYQFPATVGHIPLPEKIGEINALIEQKQKEIAKWKKMFQEQQNLNAGIIRKQQKEVEELRKDTRMLNRMQSDTSWHERLHYNIHGDLVGWFVLGSGNPEPTSDLRQAIDAAMQETKTLT